MLVTADMKPDSADGLCTIQRAILNCVLTNPEPRNCCNIINRLLDSPGCPDGISAEILDLAILTMSHPGMTRTPLLTYVGSRAFEDGWIPGPVYRTVRVGTGLFALISDYAPRRTSFWDASPLATHVPAALLLGCASWEMELDPEISGERSEQAGRRIRCRSVHCLSSRFQCVLESISAFRTSGDLSHCLSFVQSEAWPISCYSEPEDPHVLNQTDFRRLCLRRASRECIPHGSMIGMRRGRPEKSADSQLFLQSVPKIQCHPARSKNKIILLLEQPACGRNLWGDVAILQESANVKVLAGMNTGDSIGLEVSTDELAALSWGKLVCEMPFDPLSLETYAMMLKHGTD